MSGGRTHCQTRNKPLRTDSQAHWQTAIFPRRRWPSSHPARPSGVFCSRWTFVSGISSANPIFSTVPHSKTDVVLAEHRRWVPCSRAKYCSSPRRDMCLQVRGRTRMQRRHVRSTLTCDTICIDVRAPPPLSKPCGLWRSHSYHAVDSDGCCWVWSET